MIGITQLLQCSSPTTAAKGLLRNSLRYLCSSNTARTLVYHHDDCLLHAHAYSHPEQPERTRTALTRLREAEGIAVEFREAPLVDESHILAAHSEKLWNKLKGLDTAAQKLGRVEQVDGDTFLNGHSIEAAKRASGAIIAGIDHVFAREDGKAFCCTRPPGHHANQHVSMGFCLVNHVVVGAKYARAKYGISRVAILDFDVHHGNGTQDMLWSDPNGFYVSTHQYPFYPGTGASSEQGDFENVMNLPLNAGDGGSTFRKYIEDFAIPFLRQNEPELLILSAGFDAHKRDPLGGLRLDEDDFAFVTKEAVNLAREMCNGRVVSILEGGYNVNALADSVLAHVRELAAE